MKKQLRKLYNIIAYLYLSPLLKAEQSQSAEINERSTEYSFALNCLNEYCTGKILDIGSGKSSWPHLLASCGFKVTAIDKMRGYWDTFLNRHYRIKPDDITNTKLKDKFQFATCISVLEHIDNHKAAIMNIHNLLEKDGYFVLTVPYNEHWYHADIYKHRWAGYGKDYNMITQVFSRKEIYEWIENTSFEIVKQHYYKAFTGAFWTMGHRISPCIQTGNIDSHHLTCILFKKTT
jgi:2-polyprenyl-3-methyl-5-hydroxy-6-metoxy-1,4-benzoquinol methylase